MNNYINDIIEIKEKEAPAPTATNESILGEKCSKALKPFLK